MSTDTITIYQFEKIFDFKFNLDYPRGIDIINYDKNLAKELMYIWNQTCSQRVSIEECNELNPEGVFLAKCEGKFVGFALVDVNNLDQGSKIGEILEIMVLKEYRKRGIGSTLLKRIEIYFKSKGVERITFSIQFNENMAALKLARKFGFEIKAIREFNIERSRTAGRLLKYNYIYKLLKVDCIHCNKKVEFLNALLLNKCTNCGKFLDLEPMASL